VYVAVKRKLSVGDRWPSATEQGRRLQGLPEEDMPIPADGSPVEIVLNPSACRSDERRTDLETVSGGGGAPWSVGGEPVFTAPPNRDQGAPQAGGLPTSQDGALRRATGRRFHQEVTVGQITSSSSPNLVNDKMHARSIGPYRW